MTQTVVQSTALVKVAGGSSITFSLSGVTVGNALVITLAYGAASTNTAQATYPAGWVVNSIRSEGGGGRADVAVLPNAAAGTHSVTVSFASGTYATGEMHEVSGTDTTSPVDLVLTIANTTASLVPTATNHTTAQPNEIIFGVAASDPYYGSGTQTCTQPTGYTQLWQETDANTNAVGVGAYKVLSAITTVTDAWTAPSGSYNYAIAVSLKAASTTSNTASGSATITPTAKGSAAASQSSKGSSTLSLTAAGAALAILSAVGSASIHPAATGSASASQSARANATLQPTASGSATQNATNSATGSATLTPQANGSALAHLSAQGHATFTPSAKGSAFSRQLARGSARADPIAHGSAYALLSAQGSASIHPSAHGSVTYSGTNYAHGSGSLRPTAQGIAQAYAKALGSASVAFEAKGYASAFLPASGAATVSFSAHGTLYGSQSAKGSASLQPAASGAVHPPFVGYPADPNFYILQAPRVFYAAMSARSFYASIPSRSFYVLDDTTMPAQTFPGVMDPAEIKVLTIDGTAELPSGVTLVSIVGGPIITVTQGSDPNVGNVFSGAVINTAPIAAEPPDIPVAIGANLGVQILATNPASGAAYEIRIPCQTSRGATDVVTLKAVITCSSS